MAPEFRRTETDPVTITARVASWWRLIATFNVSDLLHFTADLC
jgi:hypothetical protein